MRDERRHGNCMRNSWIRRPPNLLLRVKRPASSPGVAQSPRPLAGRLACKPAHAAMQAKRLGVYYRAEGGRKGPLAATRCGGGCVHAREVFTGLQSSDRYLEQLLE